MSKNKPKMASKRKSPRQKDSPTQADSNNSSESNSYQVEQGQVFYYLKEKAEGRNDISIKQMRETLAKRKKIYDKSKKEFESELHSLRIEIENYGSKLINRITRTIKDRVSKLVNRARKHGDDELKAFTEVSESLSSLLKAFEDSLFEQHRNRSKFSIADSNAINYFISQDMYNKFKMDSYEINVEFVPEKQIVIPFQMANFGSLIFDGHSDDEDGLDDSKQKDNADIGLSSDSDESIIVETAKKRLYRRKRRRERSDDDESESDVDSNDRTVEPPCVKSVRTESPVPIIVIYKNIF